MLGFLAMSGKSFADLAAIKASFAVIEFEVDGTIITANNVFLNAMGYTLDEIRGQHHRMFVTEGEAKSEDYRSFWGLLARGEAQVREFARVGKGGIELIEQEKADAA